MNATEGLDIDFSLIIPTRERLLKLITCLNSFFSKSKKKANQEAIIMADHDDTSIRNLGDLILQTEINAKLISVWRTEHMIRDYNNYGAQCSLGKYLWILNDDFEIITENWDEIIKEEIERFCINNGDRCAYVMVDDSTHGPSGWNCLNEKGCCCSIMTRETVEAMNGIMPWQINSWGADIQLYHIFQCLPKPRVLDLSSKIRVLHHSTHNRTAVPDEVHRRVEQISRKQFLNSEERCVYVENLINLIGC